MASQSRAKEVEEAKEYLKALLPPGSEVLTLVRSVSRSGMSRVIDFFVIDPADHGLKWISSYVAKVLGHNLSRGDQGIRIHGCGMDMCFHSVYSLSRALYPDGFGCTGKASWSDRCPSNDHSNGDRLYKPHSAECEHWHSDGGYALRYSRI